MILICFKVFLVGSFDFDMKKKWLFSQFPKGYIGFFCHKFLSYFSIFLRIFDISFFWQISVLAAKYA